MNLVIDTNIFISALIKEGVTRKIITQSRINFLFPDYEFSEIKRRKDEIIKKSGLSEKEIDILLLRLLNYVKIIPFNISLKFKEQAEEIIGDIDRDDVVFIATALAFNSRIWSDDKHFKRQKAVEIFTTREVLRLLDN